MHTASWPIDPDVPDAVLLRESASLLRAGRLVAFPTETVYGLGADATNAAAVDAIYAAKMRPRDNPPIVHVASREALRSLTTTSSSRELARLIEAFWPGPLTVVVPGTPDIIRSLGCGLPTVAIRMPRHPVALGLIEMAGVPIAAPSAPF